MALLPLPLEAALLVLPLVGVALNGTSSVLYGSVPELVAPAARLRAFSIFYTGAVAPALYGMLGDAVGVTRALVAVAVMVVLNVPLVGLLSRRLSARRAAAAA